MTMIALSVNFERWLALFLSCQVPHSLHHWNMTAESAKDGMSLARRSQRWMSSCYKEKFPDTCATNMDCSAVSCNMLFSRKKGLVEFKLSKSCKRPSLVARVKVPSLKINWAHKFTSKRRAPVLIPRLSYDMGVIQGGVFLKARLFKTKGKRLTMRVSRVRCRVRPRSFSVG